MSKADDIAFSLNYTNVYMIDVTPWLTEPTWEWIAGGIMNVTITPNETTDQTAYYDGGGQASTDVTGGQMVYAFSGHRRYGDPAQDYVVSLDYSYGEERKTNFRHIAPDGRIVQNTVTVANISPGGGDANAKSDFSFEIHNDGVPVIVKGDYAGMPEKITLEPITIKAGQTQTVNVTTEPAEASQVFLYAIGDDEVAEVTADGKITGVAEGTTQLIVRSALKPSVNIMVDVTVEPA